MSEPSSPTLQPLVAGTFVDVIDARSLPTPAWRRLADGAAGTAAMGEWSPGDGGGMPSLLTGVLMKCGGGDPLGLINARPWPDFPGTALMSLWVEPSARGSVHPLEGVMRYCRWLLEEHFPNGLFAEVLTGNHKMIEILTRVGAQPAVILCQARYFAGSWHDLALHHITTDHLDRAAEHWIARMGRDGAGGREGQN